MIVFIAVLICFVLLLIEHLFMPFLDLTVYLIGPV